jgi:integrase
MTFEQQSVKFLEEMKTRNRNPVKPSTLKVYESYLRNWILPEIGQLHLKSVENGVMRQLVSKLTKAKLSASTITGIQDTVKGVIASAVDSNGNRLFPVVWNSQFIDAPVIDKRRQYTPIIPAQAISRAIARAQEDVKPLYALLAGTGLRISEAMALSTESKAVTRWVPERSVIVIESQNYRGQEQAPKTEAGYREVDLHPTLNTYLMSAFGDTEVMSADGDILFPFSVSTADRARYEDGVPGFHSFRRFRKTHLAKNNVPDSLQRYWIGHADQDVSDRYEKVGQDIEARKEWAEKVGLGFQLPNAN